jgi:hypothetical protein
MGRQGETDSAKAGSAGRNKSGESRICEPGWTPPARVRILFARVRRSISRVCWQTIEAPRLRPSLGLHSNGFMKANKVPRERNPFLLAGKRRWRPFRWIFRRTRRDDAPNNLLSQDVKPV